MPRGDGAALKTLARERDKAEVLVRLGSLPPSSVPRWGRMSVHQMVCHLSDGFRMVLREKAVSPSTSLFHRTILKWFALYLPMSWPRGVPTRPEIDQHLGGTRPVEFAADVVELEALIELVTGQPERFDGHMHPIFGPLPASTWLRWGYLHMDHHLRQFGA